MNESAQTKIRPTGRESDKAILYALPLNQRPIPLTRTKEATANAEKTNNNLIRFIDGPPLIMMKTCLSNLYGFII